MHQIINEETRTDRKQWVWTERNALRAVDIETVIEQYRDYWPLTARFVYYRLISSPCIESTHWKWKNKTIDVYGALGRTLKWMRIDDWIPMEAITDEHRIITEKLGYASAGEFISQQLADVGRGYARCNAQRQYYHVEVWIEKATLLHIVEPVADEYCRRVVVCKGYQSITFQSTFYERALEAMDLGMVPIVLYFGDWDPSGVNMIQAAVQTLTEDLLLDGVEYYRCGINPEHFGELTANPVPINMRDSRSRRFTHEHGSTAYEIDAFTPERLQQLVRESIQAFTDMDTYIDNKQREESERKKLRQWRERVVRYGTELAGKMEV